MSRDDELLHTLDELADAMRANARRSELIAERAAQIKRDRAAGVPWRELVSEEQRPLIVEMLSHNVAVLSSLGSRIRREEARALHDDGLSMERIAKLFGVSRQRISELLRQDEPSGQ